MKKIMELSISIYYYNQNDYSEKFRERKYIDFVGDVYELRTIIGRIKAHGISILEHDMHKTWTEVIPPSQIYKIVISQPGNNTNTNLTKELEQQKA